ncbi:maker492 [Drosophila busckii]|uniref:Maker492 n=1 Tax=Drosophila busckii TaxID=30019 RepID=A0A0M5J1S4_DROBS|nr:maker492 [Drosophila busckii]
MIKLIKLIVLEHMPVVGGLINVGFAKADYHQCNEYCLSIGTPLVAHLTDCKSQQIDKIQQQENLIRTLQELSNSKDALIAEVDKQVEQLESELKIKSENPDHSQAYSCLSFVNSSDVHTIAIAGHESFEVCCDSKTAGSGWTVIQRRQDGSVSFNRTWSEYREGFGQLNGEFFIGLDKLHLLTNSAPYELYIQLIDYHNEQRYAHYDHFVIGNEADSYSIKSMGKFTGNVTDSMDLWHVNRKFSTPDRDNDLSARHCAAEYLSGWWFDNCYMCNLNGPYLPSCDSLAGIQWRDWTHENLKYVQMMIRPCNLSKFTV